MNKKFIILAVLPLFFFSCFNSSRAQTTHRLDSIPLSWTVTVNGTAVTVTPYTGYDNQLGYVNILEGATVGVMPNDSAQVCGVKVRRRVYVNGHECVPMNDSVLFALTNIGATSETQIGDYFAWGETTGNKSTYSWSNYQWGNIPTGSCTRYTGNDYSVLLPNDDAAHVNWGGLWRMPKDNEWMMLYDTTNYVRTITTNYKGTGVKGMIYTRMTGAHKGNTFFLPATGYYDNEDLMMPDSGEYWSSTLGTRVSIGTTQDAIAMEFSTGGSPNIYCRNIIDRAAGIPVRALVMSESLAQQSLVSVAYGDNGMWTFVMPDEGTVLKAVGCGSPNLAWSSAEGFVYLGIERGTVPELSVSANVAFHYGSSDTSVATVNSVGHITPKQVGTTTIYAVHYWNEGDGYAYDSAYFTFRVLAPDTLTLLAEPTTRGIVRAIWANNYVNDLGGGRYCVIPGTRMVVKAYPYAHCHLTGWSDGAGVYEGGTDTIVVGGSMTLRAYFGSDGLLVRAAVYGGLETGSVNDGRSDTTFVVQEGGSVQLTATAAPCYHFSYWTDGVSVFTSNPLTVSATRDTIFVAVFQKDNPARGDTTAIGEGSYSWHGTDYTESGTYYDTLTTAGGCDSIVAAHLIILPPDAGVPRLDSIPVGWTVRVNGAPVVVTPYTQFDTHLGYVDVAAGATVVVTPDDTVNVCGVKARRRVYVNGHECLPMGDSVLWATTNMGADSVYQGGDYYAWGDPVVNGSYGWETYRFGSIPSGNCSRYAGSDTLTLIPEDDAAHVGWGGLWRMPTEEDLERLYAWGEYSRSLVTDYKGTGAKGVIYTRRGGAFEGNSLFLPAAGVQDHTSITHADTGYYWSSTLHREANTTRHARVMVFFTQTDEYLNSCITSYADRCAGLSIRPMLVSDSLAQLSLVEVAYAGDGSWSFTMPDAGVVVRATGCGDPALAWSRTEDNIYMGSDWSQPVLDNPAGLTVHYGSSDTTVATIDSNGTMTIVGAGSATLYAVHYRAQGDGYSYDSVAYTLTLMPVDTLTVMVNDAWMGTAGLQGGYLTEIVGGSYRVPHGATVVAEATPRNCHSFAGWSNGHIGVTDTLTVSHNDTLIASFVQDTVIQSEVTDTVYGQLYWHGHNYDSTGTYIDTVQTTEGCDSIVVLHLTVYPKSYRLDSIPMGWTVTVDGESVAVTLYSAPSDTLGYAMVPERSQVVLTPIYPDRVDSVSLETSPTNGHEYVDLGNGLWWATCNVGANSVYQAGDYFAWGEVETHYSSIDPLVWKEGFDDGYSEWNYRLGRVAYYDVYYDDEYYETDSFMVFTKYCDSNIFGYNGYTDTFTVLEPMDDAAHVYWGGAWRMPTVAEFDSLMANPSTYHWADNYQGSGVSGLVFLGNGDSIFLPAGGGMFSDGVGVKYDSTDCRYWTASFFKDFTYPYYAFALDYSPWYQGTIGSYREWGYNIRPVMDAIPNVSIAAHRSSDGSWSFTMPSSNTIIKGTLAYDTLTLGVNNTAMGSVTLQANSSVTDLGDGIYRMPRGTQTVITASATTCNHLAAWSTGNSQLTSNTYTLTVNQSTTLTAFFERNAALQEDTSATTCDSFNWRGQTYTSSGNYTDSLLTSQGCDSILTLQLTVNHNTEGDTTAAVCDSMRWYGTLYTATPTQAPTHFFPNGNAAGCDSTTTLHLTVYHPSVGDTTAEACDQFVWHGYNLTASVDTTYLIQNVAGCDSIVTLHLTVHYQNSGDTNAVEYAPFSWYEYTDLSAPQEVTHVLTGANRWGCDSTVTLHLRYPLYATVWNGDTTVTYTALPQSGLSASYVDDNGATLGTVLTFTRGSEVFVSPNYPVNAGIYTVTARPLANAVLDSLIEATTTFSILPAPVQVNGVEVEQVKFEDGNAIATVTNQGILDGLLGNDTLGHTAMATFAQSTPGTAIDITVSYSLTGNSQGNYQLNPASEVLHSGVILENYVTDGEGISINPYGYCWGSNTLDYDLVSGNPDQYKVDFDNPLFTDMDWTDIATPGKLILNVPDGIATDDYSATLQLRNHNYPSFLSDPITITFHVDLPQAYVQPLFYDIITLIDTCHCMTDIQWYHRAPGASIWYMIPGANDYIYHEEGGLTGEYMVRVKINGVETYTCPQGNLHHLLDGIEAVEECGKATLTVYPNPTTDAVTVTFKNEKTRGEGHTLRVMNMVGAEMVHRTFQGERTMIELSEYPSGQYMVSVDGVVVKLIKK